jgi:choline monooxygenase
MAGPVTTGWEWSAESLAAVGLARLGALYTDAAFADLERERVFWSSWVLVAAAEEVRPGSALAVDLAGASVAIWRRPTGELAAFHNLCPHRGIPLIGLPGPVGRFVTCPYHQWSFDLDGRLARISQPEEFPHADRTAIRLRPVAVVEWHGLVFACLAEPAPDFSSVVAPLEKRIAAHLTAPWVEVTRRDYMLACNWKLLVENHVDVYHLWYLHQRSLSGYRHEEFRWEWQGETWWSWEPARHPTPPGPGGARPVGRHPEGIGAHLVFPNLMVVTTGDFLATYDARPQGPDRTAVTLRIRSTPDADPDTLVGSIRAFLDEDIVACESLQRTVGSPVFGVGPTARSHEAPVLQFHQLLRQKLNSP